MEVDGEDDLMVIFVIFQAFIDLEAEIEDALPQFQELVLSLR